VADKIGAIIRPAATIIIQKSPAERNPKVGWRGRDSNLTFRLSHFFSGQRRLNEFSVTLKKKNRTKAIGASFQVL
jgi:hypothetical protein